LARCDRAIRIAPYECDYRVEIAGLLRRFAPEKAVERVRPCLVLEPRNAALHHELGLDLRAVQTATAANEGARELLRASTLAPFSARYRQDAQVASQPSFGQP